MVAQGSPGGPDHTVTVDWHGRPVEAARPGTIRDASFALSEDTVRRTERAAAAVRRIGDRSGGVLDVGARLLLRAEGLASSAIEGLRADAADVALAMAAGREAETIAGPTAAWVADNLDVVTASLSVAGRLDEARLLRWHRQLMRHAIGIDPAHVGAYRDRLGWVGGTSPLTAAHVATPPEHIPELIRDLLAFCTRTDLDAVTQAAVAHAQFETVHPFADGNGRIGRILVGWILTRRLSVPVPPPVSLQLARDVGGYQAGLTLYRQARVEAWVAWFADTVEAAAEITLDALERADDLQSAWREQVADLRADSTARRLVDVLPAHPALNASSAAALLDVSQQAARTALGELARRRIVTEVEHRERRPGRPRRWWLASELLGIVGS